MNYQYDVIIIGGGVCGTSIARELSKYRLKVALLEKEEELAFGVSKSNSGIIHPGTQTPSDSLKGKLCVRGNRLTREIAKDLGVDLKEVGELIVAFNQEDIERLKAIKEEAEKLGVEGLEIVDREWINEHEPNLSKDVIAALYAPTAGIISPYRWVYDMAENAKANGVEIFAGHCVTDIRRDVALNRTDAALRRPYIIITKMAEFQTRYIVNCAGLYADEIARMAGINDIKISPRKGEEYLLDKKKENIANHLIFPLPDKASKGILIIKTSDGNPMIGPTAVNTDDKEDLSTSEEGLNKVLEGVKKMMPSIDERDVIAYFAGLRPVAGDDFIIRHEDSVPGFINVAGIQSPGLTAAPAIAEMVTDLLRKCGLKLSRKMFFRRYRPKSVHLFSTPYESMKELIKRDKSYGDIVCRCEMVSAKEIREAVKRGASTLDGIKFRTRAQAGRCHGGFCTLRIMKVLCEERGIAIENVTKRGKGSEIIKSRRA